MNRIFSRIKMSIWEWIKTAREAVPIHATWKFVFTCALFGAVVFGFLGWLADRGYQAKQQTVPAQSKPTPPTKSGNATTTSDQSPAVTGDGNTITYDQPSDSKKPKPKPK